VNYPFKETCTETGRCEQLFYTNIEGF